MARIAYRLEPPEGGGFHFGREGLALESADVSFPSDSLFAALIATLYQIYPPDKATAVVEAIAGGAVRLSSVFPYAGPLPLFPMPSMKVRLKENECDESGDQAGSPKIAKKLKKVGYVSAGILSLMLSGAVMKDWLPSEDNDNSSGQLINGGKVWVTNEEAAQLPHEMRCKALWKNEPVTRVTVDRHSNATSVYQVARTVFRPGCGLWVMADVADEFALMLSTVLELLELLGDSGIGGERSAGYGQFVLREMETPQLPAPDVGDRAMLLSRYSPHVEELHGGVLRGPVAYELVDVGGWYASPRNGSQLRQRVRMLEAGAVISTAEGVPLGQLVDVAPADSPHPIYRGGIALLVGVNAKGDCE